MRISFYKPWVAQNEHRGFGQEKDGVSYCGARSSTGCDPSSYGGVMSTREEQFHEFISAYVGHAQEGITVRIVN
ncbi:MAG: hypothetical protein O2992_09140 [Gemmatimonadetes bacterium]|nr:hypothetical protein [Gemmatimonadota bacterium]